MLVFRQTREVRGSGHHGGILGIAVTCALSCSTESSEALLVLSACPSGIKLVDGRNLSAGIRTFHGQPARSVCLSL